MTKDLNQLKLMITTALIMAAGRGTRMRELAASIPKHLILVNERPFISYLLDRLVAAGIKKIILSVGHQRQAWSDWLSAQTYPLTVIDQFATLPEKYGTACPIEAAAPQLLSESFLVVMGDNLYSTNDIKNLLATKAENAVSGFWHPQPERYGVLVIKDGQLARITEKPTGFIGNIINTGLYVFSPAIIPIVRQLTPSLRGEYEITDAINTLAQQQPVSIYQLRDYWQDFGRPEDIPAMAEFIKQHPK